MPSFLKKLTNEIDKLMIKLWQGKTQLHSYTASPDPGALTALVVAARFHERAGHNLYDNRPQLLYRLTSKAIMKHNIFIKNERTSTLEDFIHTMSV